VLYATSVGDEAREGRDDEDEGDADAAGQEGDATGPVDEAGPGDEEAADAPAAATNSTDPTAAIISTISTYKAKLNPSRSYDFGARPGSAAARPLDVTMKFGGSSLASAERVDHVAHLIRDQIHPPAAEEEDGTTAGEEVAPVRPRAGESALGNLADR
jgi:hypothetical protein